MKYLFFIAILMYGLQSSAQSEEVKFFIDTTIIVLKNNVPDSRKYNWNELKEKAYSKARSANSPYQMGDAIRYLYQALNDFHGIFFYKDSSFKWEPKTLVFSDSITKEWKKGVKVQTQLLGNSIGYLRIPYISFNGEEEANKKAQNLNDSLCSLLQKNIKGIIIDLRLNGGGDMHPMILGLDQLLPKGRIGSFVSKTKEDWILKDHSLYIGKNSRTSINPKCNIDAERIPMVILTSPATGSSGEFLTIALKGRKKTILIGSETAGYVTIIKGVSIKNQEGHMNFSVGYGADRKGKIYKGAIAPDIPLNATDKFNDIENDEKVIAAINWLKEQF